MSTKYLLTKLAEEAGEVVVAALKHKLHRNAVTRVELAKEVGDLLAVVQILCEKLQLSNKTIIHQQEERYARERARVKSRK
jgi:NTP pyrophosphatase (non-canonical NTP hydrolase)